MHWFNFLTILFLALSSTAPNPNLIQACIDYLSQPEALKEEGLFRVPGDATIIRKYHLAYMEAAPNYTLLQQGIMKELDPNNISGLLKLHLREHPLFSTKTFTAIREKFDHLDTQVTRQDIITRYLNNNHAAWYLCMGSARFVNNL